jgi:hypothetical protein
MTDGDKPEALIIEGYIANNGNGGIDAIMVLKEIERIRSGLLQAVDGLEILSGRTPTTAQMRHEWREMKRHRT